MPSGSGMQWNPVGEYRTRLLLQWVNCRENSVD